MKKLISFFLAVLMVFGVMPIIAFGEENEEISIVPLSSEIEPQAGILNFNTLEIEENEIYASVVGYELKKGHTLSISNSDYVFSVRVLKDGNYNTLLKSATADSYTAKEDMTIGMLIRKPDKSPLTEEEISSVKIIDSQYGMVGVPGYAHRFTVEAETIDGGTATTRAAIFLPESYSENGKATPLIVMTNGGSAYLTESSWQGNTELNRNLVKTYLENGYSVLINDNTAGKVINNSNEMVPDLGCLQQLSGLIKSYEYACKVLNLEQQFSIHARSQGTFVGIRIMREYPELVKCALITGPNVSAAHRWTVITNKEHTAQRFGFTDLTGNTFEADKFVNNDIYTDMADDNYRLPPTFWMESSNDVCPNNNKSIYEVVERLRDLNCIAEYQKFSDLTHSETCRLASEEAVAAALTFLKKYEENASEHRFSAWETVKEATCTENGKMERKCADCGFSEYIEIPGLSGHMPGENESVCRFCGKSIVKKVVAEISPEPGHFYDTDGRFCAADNYAHIIDYDLKKGQILSISDTDYVFAVRKKSGTDYSTLLKEANTEVFIASEDMTIAVRIRKPDKTALTAEEIASVKLYVSEYEEHIHNFGEWFFVDNDTRRRTCSCGMEDTVYRLSLPTDYSGLLYIENNPDGLYCGTRNAADVLGFKSGTFTNGELTVTVEGTKITVSGTSSKTYYYDLQKGEFRVPDYKRDIGYSLPDGNYRLAFSGSGSFMPTLCIRNPDGNGNLMVLSNGNYSVTKNNIKSEDFGIPYLYFPAGKTYDYSGNIVLTIGASSIYDSQISSVELIEGTGNFSVDGYIWSAGADTDVFGYPEEAQKKENKIIYSDGKTDYITLFLPQPKGMLEIQMNLVNNDSTNAYGWRLNMMYACDDELNRLFPVTQSGEYEMAINIKGRPDFIGMGAHGSERMTSFGIFIDGEETKLEDIANLTEWKTVRIIRESDMYDPLDETTVVGKHFVEYLFDESGLTVNQSVEWITDASCASSYMMMFPVRRKYNDIQITDTYYDNFDSNEYDVSEAGFKTYPSNWTSGATKMTVYSKKSGVSASMEWLDSTELPGGGFKMCSNSESYNKLYFTICGKNKYGEAKTGDIWKTSTRYEVVIEKSLLADLNLDGNIDVMDVYTARLAAAKLLSPTEEQIALGDVDSDGKITAIDANIIRKYILGIIKSLPVS